MVEKWVTMIRCRVATPALAVLARVWGFSPGLCVSMIVILLVGALVIRAYPGHESQRRQIAAAFGAVNTFYGVPQMNRDGSRFTYVATTDTRGCALYLCDTQTKQTQKIAFEEDGLGAWSDDYELRAGPWAPDDSAFIYTMRDKLIIYPTEPGGKPIELTVAMNSISQLVWLTPEKFAFVEGKTNLCYAQRQKNGQWQYQSCGLPTYDDILNLTTISSDTVAWLQNGLICRLNLDQCQSADQKVSDINSNQMNLAQSQKLPLVATAEPDVAPPADGLVLWLDASTLKQRNQSLVDNLMDLSASHNNAIEYGHPPVFNAPGSPGTLNGRGTIHFSSSHIAANSTGLRTAGPLGIKGSEPRTIYAVMRRDAGKAMYVSVGTSGVPGEYCGLSDEQWKLYLPAEMTGTGNSFPPLAPRWNILSVVCDGDDQRGFVNGMLKGASYYALNTLDMEVELGLRLPKSSGKWTTAGSDGDFAELLIYNRALSPAEQQQVENYLSAKWFGGDIITARNPLVWINPGMRGITDFAYSSTTGQLLIRNEDGPKNTFWVYDSKDGLSPIMQADSVPGARWVDPQHFTYVGDRSGHNQIVLAGIHGTEKSRLFQNGNVSWFGLAPTGSKMLALGTVSNEPSAGIWQYDLGTGQLQSEVAYSEHPYEDAQKISAFHCNIRRDWPPINCTVYPPPNVEPGKKYPLVISDTVIRDPIHGPMFQSAIADCGAYVAIVERDYWPAGIEGWATNVLNLYENLKHNPAIDQQRVYLFAASAETQYLSQLVETNPEPWRGIILLNPGQLPDFSKSSRFKPRPKILLSAGSQEDDDERFKQYQQDALKQGALAEYTISPSETHRFVGKTANLKRLEAVEHFIFDE